MMQTYKEWVAVAALSSFALIKLVPQYSVNDSFTLTALSILTGEWLIWVLYAIVLYPRFLSPLRHLPGPKGGSFFNGQFRLIRKLPAGEPHKKWINTIPNEGLIRYLFLGNRERVFLTSPKALAEVLNTKSYIFVKPPQVRFTLARVLGNGLLLAEGNEHKAQRKNLMPAFSFRHIKELYPVFWDKGLELNKKLDQHIQEKGDNAVEVGHWVSRATLDIIGLAGMGRDFDTLEHPGNELSKSYQTILTPSRAAQILGMLSFFIPPRLISYIPTKRNEDLAEAARISRQTSLDLIQHKKREMSEKGRTTKDIISVALESGFFTESELVNQMMTFLLAGHETTATSMQWAIYALSIHPEMQSRLRTEIQAHLSPSRTPHLSAEALDSLPFLHAFCHEVLRFHAPVPMTLRYASENTTILGQYIPKGTVVIISPKAVNFSTALWGADAEEFKPDRWLSEDGKLVNNHGGATSAYAFLTFNHGIRSCIGQSFAVAEFKALLASWVGQWETEMVNPDEKLDIKEGITSKPKQGMNVRVRKATWE